MPGLAERGRAATAFQPPPLPPPPVPAWARVPVSCAGGGGEAGGGFFHSLPGGRNGPKPKGIPRRLAAASCLFLVGCTSFGQAAEGAFLPPKPSPTMASTVVPPTPFAPNAPTGLPSTASPAETQIGDWPAPNTYGRAATPPIPIPPPAEPFTFPERTLNVLLLGSDRRSGIGFRTDTILIASVQPATGLVALISIPRDLYVYLPGYTISRINTAWIYGETLGTPGGGPQLLFDTVRYNLGVPIDRYALVEMAGFQQIVDILGGVDVRVACDFTDWRLRQPGLPQQALSSWALFTMPRGVAHLDGDAALWYARSRSRSSDFDRARRQHDVLRALYRAALRPEVLTRIPELYRALGSAVKTNGDLDDVLSLAPFADEPRAGPSAQPLHRPGPGSQLPSPGQRRGRAAPAGRGHPEPLGRGLRPLRRVRTQLPFVLKSCRDRRSRRHSWSRSDCCTRVLTPSSRKAILHRTGSRM